MTQPYTQAELRPRLADVQRGVAASITGMTMEQYNHGTETAWSPAGYLKHLLLSNKPFIKGLGLPKPQLESMFGTASQPSHTYDEVVEIYTRKIADGARAENVPQVTPVSYRLPADITDERAYLVDSWNAAHNSLYNVLETWSEEELDRYLMPHPVMGSITIREMLFFTLHHNTMHWNDIRQGAS